MDKIFIEARSQSVCINLYLSHRIAMTSISNRAFDLLFFGYSRFLKEEEKAALKFLEHSVWNALKYFPKLEKKSICVYFYARELTPDGNLAQFIPLGHPCYRSKATKLKIGTEFSIVLSKRALSLTELGRYYVICHELEHVAQCVRSKKEYFYSCILRDFGSDVTGMLKYNVPSEIDADRKAKNLLIKIFGQEKLDVFVNRYASSSDTQEQIFAEYFRLLNLSEDYDFEEEVIKYWTKYEMSAKLKYLRTEMSLFERRILENYVYANK